MAMPEKLVSLNNENSIIFVSAIIALKGWKNNESN